MKSSSSLIEYRALCFGVLVGITMTALHWFLWGRVIGAIGIQRYVDFTRQHSTAMTLISCCISAAHGVGVGAVVAWVARQRTYEYAVAATLLTTFLSILYSLITNGYLLRFGLGYILKMFFFSFPTLLMIVGALLGAYTAQSVKRNRNVKID